MNSLPLLSGDKAQQSDAKNHRAMRTLMALCLLFNNLFTGLVHMQIAGISDSFKRAYNVDARYVNMCISSFLLGLVIFGLPANFWIHKLGFKWCFTLTMFLQALGAFIRLFINEWGYFLHVGFFLSGVGAPFSMNSTYFFCNKYFPKSVALLLVSVLELVEPLGGGLGFVLPLAFVDLKADDDKFRDQFQRYQEVTFVAFSVFLLFYALVLRDLPVPHPVNSAVSIQNDSKSLQGEEQEVPKALAIPDDPVQKAVFG